MLKRNSFILSVATCITAGWFFSQILCHAESEWFRSNKDFVPDYLHGRPHSVG